MNPAMAFRYPKADEPPSPLQYKHGQQHQHQHQHQHLPQQSGHGCCSEQTTGVGYRSSSFGLGIDLLSQGIGHASGYLGQGHGRINENFPSSNIIREEIQRAIEKERIRDEIIAAEIARRRILEAEVRAELRMERELALRVKGGSALEKFPYPVGARVPLEPRGTPFLQEAKGLSLEERITMNVEERLRMRARLEAQGFDAVPFQASKTTNPKVETAVPSHSESGQQKEKIVFLVKPGADSSVEKCKVASPSEESANLLFTVENRKGNGRWSCEICGVSTSSEHVLNEHFKGKKHKAALQGKRNGCYIGLGVLSSNNLKPIIKVSPVLKPAQELKLGGEAPQIGQNEPSLKCLDENSVSIMTDNAKNKKLKEKILQKAPSKQKEKNNFMFWCDMCQVGADHEKVMEAHRNSKKHAKLLQKTSDKGQAILIPQFSGCQGKNGFNKASIADNQAFNFVDCTTKADHVQNKDVNVSEKVKQETETKLVGEDPTLGCGETNVFQTAEDNSWETIQKKSEYAILKNVNHCDRQQEQLNGQFAETQISDDQGVKPGANLSGTKNKAVPPAEESANHLFSFGNTKGNEVWICEICGMSTTSALVLNDHIQGKKHKAALDGKKKSCCIKRGFLPNNNLNSIMEVTCVSNSKEELISGEETPQIGQSGPSALSILSTKCLDENRASIMPENANNKKLEEKILQTALNKIKEKNDFTFWCDMCQFGTDNEKVMEVHGKGKKHAKLLQKATGQAILIPQVLGGQGGNGSTEATKRDSQASDNVDGTKKVQHMERMDLNGIENVKQEVETACFGEGPTWGFRETIVKPVADNSETKSKVVSPAEESANQLFDVGNAERDGVWSCEICGINTTSEHHLNAHNRGKKHKSKEAALMSKKNGSDILQRRMPKENNCMFWCDMCQVGSDHKKVMEDHRKGKKHKHAELLQKAGQNVQASFIFQTVGRQGGKGSNEATKGDNQGFDNVDKTIKEEYVDSKDSNANEKVGQEVETEIFGEDLACGHVEINVESKDSNANEKVGQKVETEFFGEDLACGHMEINKPEQTVFDAQLCSDLNEKFPPVQSVEPGGKEFTFRRFFSKLGSL